MFEVLYLKVDPQTLTLALVEDSQSAISEDDRQPPVVYRASCLFFQLVAKNRQLESIRLSKTPEALPYLTLNDFTDPGTRHSTLGQRDREGGVRRWGYW
ncbi:MAG: hypothetical protein SW833_16605 [Cyanobacteriota bacterium]|nr:hypothetical protein [Cyanobacteriota bacterium]